jgi:hypothetical protein
MYTVIWLVKDTISIPGSPVWNDYNPFLINLYRSIFNLLYHYYIDAMIKLCTVLIL